MLRIIRYAIVTPYVMFQGSLVETNLLDANFYVIKDAVESGCLRYRCRKVISDIRK